MERFCIGKHESIGLGFGGRVFYAEDLKKMRVGEEYNNSIEGGELVLRVTGVMNAATTRLFLQLENRLYDNDGVLEDTVVVAKYVVERG
jgi:hypothetical protein